jgi:hypothetical protein
MDEESEYVLNPWLSVDPDCSKQSAGDWFTIMLTASMGGKSVHGCNAAPACEVICKANDYANVEAGVGFVRWDPKVAKRPLIGKDISDQYYKRHAFKGTVTTSGNILAYESGLWEPSMRARAKSTSLLAAGIHAHGCTLKDAIETVSIIASDEIDEEAVSSAILPASHLKREMTIVSKANHRIFSRGTIQSGIEWDDANLNISSNATSMAFDWGRVTAIARFVAEGNIQICSMFRGLAQTTGVPYYIVRDAWAYVTPTDYHLTPDLFSSVKKVDLNAYGIPSIKGAFVDHEDDVMIAITRALDKRSLVPDSDTYRSYTSLYQSAKERKARRNKIHVVSALDYAPPSPLIHNVGTQEACDIVAEASAPFNALVRAIATRKHNDPTIRNMFERLHSIGTDSDSYLEALDNLTFSIFDKGTWLLARTIGEEAMREGAQTCLTDTSYVNLMLGRLKVDMFGHPTHVGAEVRFSNSLLVRLRPYTKKIVMEIDEVPPVASMSQMRLAGAELNETAALIASLAGKAEKWLPTIRKDVSLTFEKWAESLSDSMVPGIIQAEANFIITSYALKHLELASCMHQTTGFVDGAAPLRSYVWGGLKKLSKIYGYMVPDPKRCLYANALMMADELDSACDLPFKMRSVVEFVTNVLNDVVGDLLVDSVYLPPSMMLENVFRDNPAPSSPGYDVDIMEDAEIEDFLSLCMGEELNKADDNTRDPYIQALNSYPSANLAEQYARANGYRDFKDAFEHVGMNTMYVDTNDYIIAAQVKIGLANRPSGSRKKRKSYDPII